MGKSATFAVQRGDLLLRCTQLKLYLLPRTDGLIALALCGDSPCQKLKLCLVPHFDLPLVAVGF